MENTSATKSVVMAKYHSVLGLLFSKLTKPGPEPIHAHNINETGYIETMNFLLEKSGMQRYNPTFYIHGIFPDPPKQFTHGFQMDG